MEIDKAIRIFVNFINNSWVIALESLKDRSYTSNENSINDWLQANWEFLVERKVLNVGEYLEVYGDGADYNGSSSRVSDPKALANFKVIIKSRNNVEILDKLNNAKVRLDDITFEKIVGFRGGFYMLEPQFDHILCFDNYLNVERVFALSDIEFYLETV